MGTRADFYVGRGVTAEWLGSIAWDGYPDGNPKTVITKMTEPEYRGAVEDLLAHDNGGATRPAQGWPWPWDTSHTTDYTYAFDGDRVWASCFGHAWFDPKKEQPDSHDDVKPTEFPNMKDRQNVVLDSRRSGIFVIGI